MKITFSYDHQKQREIFQSLLKVVGRKNSGKKVIFHFFSNNGFNFYKHTSECMKDNPHG